MAKNARRMARKPATTFPNLRKKIQKSKIQSTQVKKKGSSGFLVGEIYPNNTCCGRNGKEIYGISSLSGGYKSRPPQ
jgi:hypothetical protein